jgi:transcriptional regulator with XRE-family HTH domain
MLRQTNGLTQAQLAGADFSHGYVSLVESGRTRISLRAAGILASRLGVPLAVLLGESSMTGMGLEAALTAALRRSQELEQLAQRTQVEVKAALAMIRTTRNRTAVQRRA